MSTLDLCDLRTDTYDARHMNLRGAEKVSSYLGQFLRETLEPQKDSANVQFDTALETYRNIRRAAMLQTETDFQTYLKQLSDHREKWSWVVVGNGAFTGGLSQQDYLMLKELGLEKTADAADSMAYGAVFAQGNLKMEKLSDRYFEKHLAGENWQLRLTAATEYDSVAEDRNASVSFNGLEITISQGLTFLVWDNETGAAIDAKSFATGTPEKEFHLEQNLFRNYEASLLNSAA